MAQLKEAHELTFISLTNKMNDEKERQRQDLQKIIDELKHLLAEEKKKMGEAGKLRE